MDMNQLTNSIVFLDIKEFNETSGPFCMSFGFDIKKIIFSIEKIGLVNKPYVRRNKEGFLDIITGYRRIMALKALGWDRVPCVDLTDSGLSDTNFLILNLYDNLCTRSFNDVEKCMIINRLLLHFSIEEIYGNYMNLLNISSRREVDILTKINGFTGAAKDIIANRSIPIKTIESLIDLKDPSPSIILKWIDILKLSFNQQILFIDYIIDISIKEEIDIQKLLNENIFVEFIMEDGQNIPQKAKKFIDLLRARKLPILTRNEKVFARQISDLDLPKGVRIKHTPFFEGPDYLLEISFMNGKRLKDTVDTLARIKGLTEIEDPWKEE